MDTLEEERWARDRDLFKESAEALGAEVEDYDCCRIRCSPTGTAEKMISERVEFPSPLSRTIMKRRQPL